MPLQLNATLELEQLLKYAVNAASVMCNSDGALILLPDETRQSLILRAHYDDHFRDVGEYPTAFNVQTSLAGQVFKNGEYFLAESPKDLREALPEQQFATVLYLPMLSRTAMVGVLVVYSHDKPLAFSNFDLKQVRQLAAHAAVAFENARIYADSQARSFELAMIIDATEAVNSTLSLPRVLSLIAKNLLTALQVNWCEITTYDVPNSVLLTLAAERMTSWQQDHAPTLALSDLPHIAQPHETDLGVLTATDKRLTSSERCLLNGGAQAVLIPLQREDKFAGLMSIVYQEPIEQDARQAATSSTLWKLQRILDEIVEGVQANPEGEKRLHRLVSHVWRDMNADDCSLWLLDDEEAHLFQSVNVGSMVWVHPPHPSKQVQDTLRMTLKGLSIGTYLISDDSVPQDIRNIMLDRQLKVLVLVPFILQEDQLGLVLIGDTQRQRRFDGREINLAHALVLQAATAIKNAQLFEDLQRSLMVLQQTQAKLVQSARLSTIGELSAAVAHQINNPLTTILGDTELLLADTHPSDANYESLLAVNRAGQRAHEVVRRLLSMARQKGSDIAPQLMDINKTIHNTLALAGGTLHRARIRLTLDLGDALPPAFGIPSELEDVWLNLVLNARDALREVDSEERPEVGIVSRYNKDEESVSVLVWDNGPGLQLSDPEKLFEAFVTTKPAGEGTGLGLYICKSVVERCGGTIDFTESLAEHGAAFIVKLPTDV